MECTEQRQKINQDSDKRRLNLNPNLNLKLNLVIDKVREK